MNAKRMYYGMIGAIVLTGVLGLVGLVLGNHMLSARSKDLVQLRLKSQVLNSEQTELTQAKKDVIKYTPLNNIAASVVPQEKDQALAIREIVSFASHANIALSSITFLASNLGGTGIGTSTGTGASKVTLAPSQLTPAKGLKGIYILPITVQSDVTKPISYDQLSTFLGALELNRHTAEVSQLTITPSDSSGQHLSFNLIINIYIKK